MISTYGSCFIQFPRFTYIRNGGFEDEPFKLPRYTLDSYVLLEVCRQLAHVDKKLGMKSESGAIFPIGLGYYSCKTTSDALNLQVQLKKMKLQPYVARQGFDSKGYAIKHLNVDVNFSHIPQLEDYWEDCCDEFEVQRRLWSRFTLRQIITMKLSMNIAGVHEEEGEDVLDPEFNIRIHKQPIPEIDWDRREEENIQSKTFNVIRRIEKWLRNRKSGMRLTTTLVEKLVKQPHTTAQTLISSSDIVVDIAGATDTKSEKVQTKRFKESLFGSSSVRVTRSKNKKKSKEPRGEEAIIILDSEEAQVIMGEPEVDIPTIQDADKQKEQLEDNLNQVATLAIMDSSDYQMPPVKESPNVSRWLGASINKKRNVVPISVPIEYMVSRCLEKTSKSKRLKEKAMLEVDENTGHWVVEMAKPI